MQKRPEATRDSSSLFCKAIVCILSIMLAMSHSSIAYALDEGEAVGATVAGAEEASASLDVPTISVLSEPSFLSSTAIDFEYIDEEGSTQSATNVTVIDNSATSWSDGWYIVTDDVAISSRITVSGDVNLILADGAKLTARAGISVNESNSLTIYAQGKGTGELIATGATNCAGIGSDSDGFGTAYSSGVIIINGGNITAKGGTYAAGIGGGNGSRSGNGSGSNITINGGVIKATGGDYAAGIGGGNGTHGSGGNGENITINGGSVTANGGYRGAGIGGGHYGLGENITINGGEVTATGGDGAAGIGGGYYCSADNIKITGSTVKATGGNGAAGIGSGYDPDSSGTLTVSNITISGGVLEAIGGSGGSGIGGGEQSAKEISVTITGGVVTATGTGATGTGIGGCSVDKLYIEITGGTVIASSDNQALGNNNIYEKTATETTIKINYSIGGFYYRTSASADFTYHANTDNFSSDASYLEIYPNASLVYEIEVSASSTSSTSSSAESNTSASLDTLLETGDTQLPYLLAALIVGCLISAAVALRKLCKLRRR